MIVDDDSRITEPMEELFSDEGYEVRVVNVSRFAVPTAAFWKPDAVLLDLEMPGLDGVEVLGELRSHPEVKETPVVVLSVLARNLDGPPGNVQGFLCKPISFQEILACVRQVLQTVPAV